MPSDTARGGPEVALAAIFRTHGYISGGETSKKTLHGAPAGPVFLDFDQKRASQLT